jgi:uncharacterized integral membrane protein
MNLKLAGGIIVMILVIIFSIQNVAEVTLKVFALEFNGSLSLFLILSMLLGVIIGSLFTLVLRKNKKEKIHNKPETEKHLDGKK